MERLNQWDRVTELAFDDWASWREGAVVHVPQYTPPPYGPRGFISETIFIGDTPDHDFLGHSPSPGSLGEDGSRRLIRWLFLLRYPDAVSKDDGEAWYLGTHTQEPKHSTASGATSPGAPNTERQMQQRQRRVVGTG